MKKLAISLLGLALYTQSAQSAIIINEISYGGNASSDRIEIKNTGGSTVDISSWWTCSRFTYNQLSSLTVASGSLNLGAGGLVVLELGYDVDDTSSDFGLFNSPAFSSQSALEDFVQWGTGLDVGRTDVADAKGIWTLGDFVATAGAGESLQLGATGGDVSADWVNASDTLGAENVPEPGTSLFLAASLLLLSRRKR